MMLAVAPPPALELLSSRAVRERCGNITRAVEAGHSAHFRIDRAKLQPGSAPAMLNPHHHARGREHPLHAQSVRRPHRKRRAQIAEIFAPTQLPRGHHGKHDGGFNDTKSKHEAVQLLDEIN